MQKIIKVELQLKNNDIISREVAYEVLNRANCHDSELVERKLTELGINLESMTRYFSELQLAVAEFWDNADDMSRPLTLKPHELRGLYVPLIMAVILSSVGNAQIGNYYYVLKAIEAKKPDKQFLFEYSTKLEQVRSYITGEIGQLGNRHAEVQTSVMLSILGETSRVTAEVMTRDGASYDPALSGLAALIGLSVVEEATKTYLYSGVNEVNFRELLKTVKERNKRETLD